MLNKKLMLLAIFFVSLLAVSAVSAADNATDEVSGIEEMNDEIVSVVSNDVNETVVSNEIQLEDVVSQSDDNDENVVSISSSDENYVLSDSYLRYGDYGHIESKEMAIVQNTQQKFKVQLVGSYVSNQKVYFSVYDSDNNGKHVGDYGSVSNQNGYATLTANLKSGHYWIKISSDNHGSVYNSLTVRPNGYFYVTIHAANAKYKKNNYIDCTWWGIFAGYLKIYKGSKVVKKVSLKSNYKGDNEVGYVWFYGKSINTKKLSPGKYTAKIVNSKGKVISKKSFKIIGKAKKTAKKHKSGGKKFTLKLKAPEKTSGKTIKGNRIYAFYKYSNKGQFGRGVCIDSYGKNGPGSLKAIKLIKAKIYFKNNNGNTKVKTKKFDKYGFTKSNLISGYKPYKVVVFYK